MDRCWRATGLLRFGFDSRERVGVRRLMSAKIGGEG
jgi:hypothetical protein